MIVVILLMIMVTMLMFMVFLLMIVVIILNYRHTFWGIKIIMIVLVMI